MPATRAFLASTDAVGFTVLAAGPPPCSTFTDVDSASTFCANVLWIKNRLVTLGCLAGFYCPGDLVTRLQMAAFMNRLGTALTPVVLSTAAQTGALALDAQPVVCQTSDFATDTFERRAIVDASFSAHSASEVSFAASAVASFDDGATWVPLSATDDRGSAAAGQWGHVRARGVADLTAGQTVRFGVWISRGGLAGTADLTDSTCKLRAAIANRLTPETILHASHRLLPCVAAGVATRWPRPAPASPMSTTRACSAATSSGSRTAR